MSQVRVLRILEYVGDKDAIENHLAFDRGLRGQHDCGKYIIREGFVGEYPELLAAEPKFTEAKASNDV
jgi:hypothetical protein